MLDAGMQTQLKSYLENVREPIELVPSPDDSPKSREMTELLGEIAALSDKVSVAQAEQDDRSPSFAIRRSGTDISVRFAGLPMGHEFTSLVLALLHVGGHKPKTPEDVLDQVRALDGDYHFETYFSLSCQNCPDVVQALNLMSVVNPRIRHTAIDGGAFKDEVETRKVMAVPSIYLNGEPFGQGRMELEQILAKIDTGSESKAAEKLAKKAPFDVLVVGGPPVRQPPYMPRARASAPVCWPNALADKCSTPWASRTSHRSNIPRVQNSAPNWRSMSGITMSTS